MMELENANPTLYEQQNTLSLEQIKERKRQEDNDSYNDQIDQQEIYDIVRDIKDPEHPYTLEQLNVVSIKDIYIINNQEINLYFTPTIPNCSFSQTIGLCIKAKLLRSLPKRFKIDVIVKPGKHISEVQLNKQINDKERISAALENKEISNLVNSCISNRKIKSRR